MYFISWFILYVLSHMLIITLWSILSQSLRYFKTISKSPKTNKRMIMITTHVIHNTFSENQNPIQMAETVKKLREGFKKKNKTCSKKMLARKKNFGPQKMLGPKRILGPKNILGLKKIWVPKKFQLEKKCCLFRKTQVPKLCFLSPKIVFIEVQFVHKESFFAFSILFSSHKKSKLKIEN